MVHVYHGDGKGKTTAAMGLALRMLGAGQRVFIVQYLKGQPSGEIMALLKIPGATVLRGKPGTKFVFQMTQEEKEEVCALQMRQLGLAFEAARNGQAQMILLDEALDAIATGTLHEEALLDAIESCPKDVEIVLTGRNPSECLRSIADYITSMNKEKHPFDMGIAARKGIEY